MGGGPEWTDLGEPDRNGKLTAGTIELPETRFEALGKERVIAVRRDKKGATEPRRVVQLKVQRKAVSGPKLSDADYGSLRLVPKVKIEATELTWGEKSKRVAARAALPILMFLAAVAAIVAVVCSDLEEAMGIVTAALAAVAAGGSAIKALREP